MHDRDKKRVLCTPDDYQRIHDLTAASGYDAVLIVASSPAVPAGYVLMTPSEAEADALLRQAAQQVLDDAAARMQQQLTAEWQRLTLESSHQFQGLFAVLPPRSPFGWVTGL